MGCVQFFVKYALFFFNLLFVLVGAAFIGMGIAVLVTLGNIGDMIPAINTIPILVIVIGCIVFLISFFGCCGAIRENRCLLIMYAVCMLVLAAGNIWLAVVIFNNLGGLTTTVEGWINNAFEQHGQEPSGSFRALEELFTCCGTTGRESYDHLEFIPPSCCALDDCHDADDDSFYGGCTKRFTDYLNNFGNIVGAVVIGIVCAMFIAMIFALYLNQRITKSKRERKY